MSTIGAEMGQLQQLGQSFNRESQTVAQLTAAISGQVNSTWWKGGAADRFRASLGERVRAHVATPGGGAPAGERRGQPPARRAPAGRLLAGSPGR